MSINSWGSDLPAEVAKGFWMTNNIYRSLIAIIVIGLICFLYTSAMERFDLKKDSFFEQTIELIIEGETGMKIDLSPESSDHISNMWSDDN